MFKKSDKVVIGDGRYKHFVGFLSLSNSLKYFVFNAKASME